MKSFLSNTIAKKLFSGLIIFVFWSASSCTSERVVEENPRFNHVVLYVTDMERSVTFYRDALGLETHQRIDELTIEDESESRNVVPVTMTLMRLPGSPFIYELIENPVAYDSPTSNAHYQHVGIEVTDIEESLNRAVNNGAMEATPIRTIYAGDIITKTASFQGPDGEQIEFMQMLEGDY